MVARKVVKKRRPVKKKAKAKKKRKGIRTVALQRSELDLYLQKRRLCAHYEQVHLATLVDLQVFQKLLQTRYKLPETFTIDVTTGVVTCEAA